jgi:sugar (pentulose or hexulose) kinase
MLADVLGKPVRVAEVSEAAAIAGGRVILDARPGAWDHALPAQHYQPDEGRHAAYQAHYARYLDVFKRLSDAFGGG